MQDDLGVLLSKKKSDAEHWGKKKTKTQSLAGEIAQETSFRLLSSDITASEESCSSK